MPEEKDMSETFNPGLSGKQIEKLRGPSSLHPGPEKLSMRFGGGDFLEAHDKAIDPDTPAEERKAAREKRDGVLYEMESRGFINLDALKRELLGVIKETEWDQVVSRLNKMGMDRQATEAGRTDWDPRYSGAIPTVFNLFALEVSHKGKVGRLRSEEGNPDFDRGKWLRDHGAKSGRELEELRADTQLIKNGRIIDLRGIQVEEMVASELRKRRKKDREAVGPMFQQVEVGDLTEAIRKLAELTQQNVERPATDATNALVDALGKLPAREERERWSIAERDQDFFARFQPNQEPNFYQKLSPEQRKVFDARWQLARAVYIKQLTSAEPDKYKENKELEGIGTEQMEVLYNIPGVRKMMQGYMQSIVEGRQFALSDGRQMSFWEVENLSTFDEFRKAVAREMLSHDRSMASVGGEDRDLAAIEADAVAWNWIYAGNLAESADSRYSFTGTSHSMPGKMLAGDYKFVLHPQERFEGKSLSGHYWGAYGSWGVAQMEQIKRKSKLDLSKDEVLFLPSKGQFWAWRRTRERPSDPEKRDKRGKVIAVFAPEVYPVTAAKSFFEETKAGEKTLLESFMDGDDINWKDVSQDAWGSYIWGKFNKSVQLMEYWNPDPRNPSRALEEGKEKQWAAPLLEILGPRLKIEKTLKGLKSRRLTYQTFHNLKVAAVYASNGGVANPKDVRHTDPMGGRMDRMVMQNRLSHNKVRFLRAGTVRGEKLRFVN